MSDDDGDFIMDEDDQDYDFDYEDDEQEEPDVDLENKYYNAKGNVNHLYFLPLSELKSFNIEIMAVQSKLQTINSPTFPARLKMLRVWNNELLYYFLISQPEKKRIPMVLSKSFKASLIPKTKREIGKRQRCFQTILDINIWSNQMSTSVISTDENRLWLFFCIGVLKL